MTKKELESLIDLDFILKKLVQLEDGDLKKETFDSYTSRSLKGSTRNLSKYINSYIIKALYKYSKTNGGLK